MREDLLPIPGPTLYRLMALRNTLVALKGPLADDPLLQEGLHQRLFNHAIDNPLKDPASDARVPIEPVPLG